VAELETEINLTLSEKKNGRKR